MSTHTHKYNLFVEHISFAQIRIKFSQSTKTKSVLMYQIKVFENKY